MAALQQTNEPQSEKVWIINSALVSSSYDRKHLKMKSFIFLKITYLVASDFIAALNQTNEPDLKSRLQTA